MYAVLLTLSGASIYVTLSDVPAFNPASRQATVSGGSHVAPPSAMYDNGAYAFQRGYGFLIADGLVSSDTEARDALASRETADQRARAAIAALNEAVRLDPGNAHAWSALAWGNAQIAEDGAALKALRNSWTLAPFNRSLAETRFNLIGTLTSPEFLVVRLTERDTEAIQRDIATLGLFDQDALQFYTELAPHLTQK